MRSYSRIVAACLAGLLTGGMLAIALLCLIVPQAKAGEPISCESLVDAEGGE